MLKTERAHWRKLDTAAKIFPSTSSQRDTRVFRFYCVLQDAIEAAPLQTALDRTLEKYPVFLSVMRKGLFWYYLEKSDLHACVKEESDPPCLHLYIRERKTLLFQVTYYKNRINFEVFHALTDGTGAIEFLKELVKNYLLARFPNDKLSNIPLSPDDMTLHDQESDSFAKYYTKPSSLKKSGNNESINEHSKHHNKSSKDKSACQITGTRVEYGDLSIVEGIVSTSAIMKKAKEYGVSVTIFLTAVFLQAIHQEMSGKQRRRPAVLMLPVNLRKYFPSSSMLNFFSWINPGFDFTEENVSLEDIILHLKEYFKEELTPDRIHTRMLQLSSLEHHPLLRMLPLEIKSLGMWVAMKAGKKNTSAIFSNLGFIQLPAEYCPYIQYFGVFTSTPKTELSICSFEDNMTLSLSSNFQEQNIERNFFRLLKEQNVTPKMLENDFPKEKSTIYQSILFFKIFTFVGIASSVITFMVNIIFTPHNYWSLFVIAGAFCMWLSLAIGFFRRHNLLKNGIWQLIIISTCCILWDKFTGWRGWSIDFVYPAVCLVILLSMFIITKVQRYPVQEYMIYYILCCVFGINPAILYLTGIATIPYLAVTCGGIHFLFLIGLLIFKSKDVLSELHKKFHM